MSSHLIEQVIVRAPRLVKICKFVKLWEFNAYEISDNRGLIMLENAQNYEILTIISTE